MQNREALWRTGKDEPVEVNQHALIYKVLARYSGEFTLFRELLQNSDDARSSKVEIHFETAEHLDRRDQREENPDASTLPDLKCASVTQWRFRNNGDAFTEQDWTRLQKIAEGNPCSEKIGAFGVGFYSLFSVTDRPFVSSKGYGMQFHSKNTQNQLYVRHGNLPSRETPDPWTTFEIPLREAGPIPPALDFLRFLASSITFMVNLRDVGVFVAEHCIGRIKKLPGTVQGVCVSGQLKRSSPLSIMNVKEIQCHLMTIEAEVVNAVYATGIGKSPSQVVSESHDRGAFFSSSQSLSPLRTPTSTEQPGDPKLQHRTTVDLTVFTAEVNVELDKKLSVELLRSTRKQAPSRLTYNLIYTGKDEYDRSVADQNDQTGMCDSIFQGLRADLNGSMHTRVFIGHATGQTTGVGGHMASYFIPTVERESIDLVDRNIAIWNKELLHIGGFLCRAVYELELFKIRDAWEEAAGSNGTLDFRPPAQLQDTLHQQFLHLLKFFTFHCSTPSTKVARLLEAAFFECSTAPLRLLSSAGVRSAPDIKEYDQAVATFLKYLPMLPHYVVQECPRIIKELPEQHKISCITFSDVLQELHKHALTQEELVACLRWWMTRRDGSAHNSAMLSAITLGSANGTPLQLSSVKYFIGKAYIPLDGPLPPSLMSHDITRGFPSSDLMSFGWQEFTIVDWFLHISQPEIMSADPRHDFTRSIEWAERVLSVLSGVWSPQSEQLVSLAKSILKNKKCIPTSHGLRSPEESFVSSSNTTLFRDLGLPIVRFIAVSETKGDMEGFLSSIGVQKHVPPQLLLDKMVETGNWSISDLIRYLVRVQNTLTPDEFSKWKLFKAFIEEGVQGDVGARPRYCAGELYPPLDIFKQLQLPVIDWGEESRWRNESEQAELLYRLGLRPYPPLEKIVMLASTASDATVRAAAFKYLCDNLRSKYLDYNPDNFRDIPFIAAESEDGICLAKLGDVFLGTRWKALGFSVIQDGHQKYPVTELGVQQHPPTSTLIRLLETTPPTNEETARQWFETLFECISSFSQMELTKLSELPIVPARSSTGGWEHLAPARCYLGEGTKDKFHAKLFVFVNFGSPANLFLRACGSMNEPPVQDIAESLVGDPERFYNLAGGYEGFLAELRDLASQSRRIPNITLRKMMSKPILVGIRRKKPTDRRECEYERVLRKPEEIVIADDMNSYRLFEDTILVAPRDSGLEGFYMSLGCRRLSTVIEEDYKASNELQDTETSTRVGSLILERLPLFLREDTHTHAQSQFLVSLPSAENFKVKVCERLVVSKTLTIGNNQTTRRQDLLAATKCDEDGQIELWLPRNTEPDMYEIALSLCRLLFGAARVGDALLLMTILSTDPEVLRRRGFNVDKIPKQQPEGPELTKEAIDSPYVASAVTTTSATNLVSEQSIMTTGSSTVVASEESSTNRPMPGSFGAPLEHTASPTPLQYSIDQASSNALSAIQNLTRLLIPRGRASETTRNVPFPLHSWTLRQVMPQSYIRANVSKALKACHPEGGKLLHHRNKVEEIREFPNEGYCDVSGQVGKLKRCGTMGDVQVFTTEDVPDADTFMTSKHDILARFVDVLTPVAELYGLSLTLLHVFYDVAGGPIAFNRDGSIFFNLRYFEAWHDQDVQKGDSQQAQISWFFALAHELAHNLIKPHNSEHEFWFSAICEAHVLTFSRLLNSKHSSKKDFHCRAPA
ncbi:hypothetical protein OG21DRAFT_1443221 [Imleria badia]|nr:hypothetical protein OG21DRAFT_1443221 [Imleria badia]